MLVTSPLGPLWLMADISEHQGTPDLEQYAAAGFQHLSVRLWSGYREDRQAARLVPMARALGLKLMFYVWVAPQNPLGVALDGMARVLDKYGPGELGYMLDVEDTGNVLSPADYRAYLGGYTSMLRSRDARLPTVYTAAWYWSNHLRGVTDWQGFPIITASYPFQTSTGVPLKPAPATLAGYGQWAFTAGDRGQGAVPAELGGTTRPWQGWQFSSIGRLPGFAGNVDLNVLRPSFIAERLGTTPSTPTPTPVPVPAPTMGDPAVKRLIAFDNDTSTVFMAKDWEAPGHCRTVEWVGGHIVAAFRPLTDDQTDPYPAPSVANPWGVKVVGADAIPNLVCEGDVPPGVWPFDRVLGARGPQGPQGPAGAAGQRGATGPQGPQGVPGASATPDVILSTVADALRNG